MSCDPQRARPDTRRPGSEEWGLPPFSYLYGRRGGEVAGPPGTFPKHMSRSVTRRPESSFDCTGCARTPV